MWPALPRHHRAGVDPCMGIHGKPLPMSACMQAVDPLAATKTRTLSRGKEVAGAPTVAAPVAAPTARQTGSGAAVPRTRSQTLAARQQGMSMSSLLQQRSEAAVTAKKPAAPPSPLPDIDSADRNNPLAATEYVNDIYSYYRRVEPKFRVQPGYMGNQVRTDACQFACKHMVPCGAHELTLLPRLKCRRISTRRCVPSSLTGWWRCT